MLRRFRSDERGAISILMAVLMVPLVGFVALSVEVGFWAMTKMRLQHAADSAAISAAINGGLNYDAEAKAVAAVMGFEDGVATTNAAPCPDSGLPDCYSVTIAADVPLLLAQVIGYRGDGHRQQHLTAMAIAKPSASAEICALAMNSITATSGDFGGCNTMANGTAQCDGSTGIGTSFAHGSTNSGCGARRVSQPVLADPYRTLAFPSSQLCGSAVSPPLSGTLSLGSGTTVLCGNQTLGGDVTVTTQLGQGGAVLVIQDGKLDLAGHTLSTSFGSALTLVFSGTSTTVTHAPVGVGGLDITPPTTGPWAGVALAQDPSTTAGVDYTIGPGWRITGLVYAPRATLTWTSPLTRSTNGKACSVVVALNLAINGGGIASSNLGQCDQAGVSPPRTSTARARLVQ